VPAYQWQLKKIARQGQRDDLTSSVLSQLKETHNTCGNTKYEVRLCAIFENVLSRRVRNASGHPLEFVNLACLSTKQAREQCAYLSKCIFSY
jgi:hypothetical protein